MKKTLTLAALLAVTLLMTSCNTFYDFDDPYYSLPEASTETLQTTMYTPEQLAERSKRLAEINKMPYPEYTLDYGDEFEIRIYNQPEMHTTTSSSLHGQLVISSAKISTLLFISTLGQKKVRMTVLNSRFHSLNTSQMHRTLLVQIL